MVSALKRFVAAFVAAVFLIASPAQAVGAWEWNGSSWVVQKPLNGATAPNTYSVLKEGWYWNGSAWTIIYLAFTPQTIPCAGVTIAIPTNSSSMAWTVSGAGGGGGVGAVVGGDGGAGGLVTRTIAIAPADWGVTISNTLANGGVGHIQTSNGSGNPGSGNVVMSTTVAAGAFTLTAGPGGGGTSVSTGSSGTATGGTVNTPGGGGAGGAGGTLHTSAGGTGADGSCQASFS